MANQIPVGSDSTRGPRGAGRRAVVVAACLGVWVHCGMRAGAAPGLTLHVATNGSDSWSGRLPAPAARGDDGPLRSAVAALRAARASRRDSAGTPGTISILFRSGRHELAEPIVIEPEDSGAGADRPLVLAAYPGEHPVLSGGRRVSGWKAVAGHPGLWSVDVPEARAGRWYFRQLFVNGRRQQRARTPNEGYFRIEGASPQDRPVRIRYKPGDIRPHWAQEGDVELIALLAWADIRMQIRAVDEEKQIATLSGNPRPSNKENNARYYIENARDALDQPGEWYLDRSTGTLLYWAQPGTDPNEAEVIAPRLDELMVLRGDARAGRVVRHVVMRGLGFSHTDWPLGPEGYADTQAAIAARGDLIATAAVDCAIVDCSFSQLGGYAIELGTGCQRVRIEGNEMSDLGGGGIRVGDTNKNPTPAEANHGHQITDNHIHRGGVVFPPAVGVLLLQSGTNWVAHNRIHHFYYTAISVGWNWGYQETPCRHNRIEFNHLHDIGQGVLSDMGAVYTLGIQHGTVVRNNLIHNVESFGYGGWGLYTDEGSTGIVLESNVVYRCKSAGFHQHYGRDNIVRNNILAFNREHQLMRTRPEPHISFWFTNNIVVFDSGQLLGSNWSNDNFRLDGNLYWDYRPDAGSGLLFAQMPLVEWRRRGHDLRSVIADPRFVDARRFDFRLRPDSPAWALGFQPIQLAEVGIRPKHRRD